MIPDGLEVNFNELATMEIKSRAKSEIADMVANKAIERISNDFIERIVESITPEEVRRQVLYQIVDEIIENWRTK